MTRARNIAGFSTITTTPSPVHVGPIGVLTATRIDGEFNLVDLDTRDITAQGIGVTNLQVSGITTGLNVSGIITAQNGINFNGTSTGLNVSGVGTIATLSVTGNATVGGVLTYEDVTNVDSVGLVTAREGIFIPDNKELKIGNTAGSPDLKLTHDTNNSIISNATGELLIDSSIINLRDLSNNSRFRIDTSGNVTLTGDKLKVFNASAPQVRINSDTGDGASTRLTIGRATGNNNFVNGAQSGDSAITFPSNLLFGVQTAEKMRIDSSGRLLLGTTTEGQSSADDLTIATSGNTGITIRSGTSNTGNLYFSDGTSSTDEFQGFIEYNHSGNLLRFGTAAEERLRITSGGLVGIGTDSPAGDLDIRGQTGTDSSRIYLISGDAADSSIYFGSANDTATGALRYEHTDDSLRIYGYNNTERLRVLSDGQLKHTAASGSTIITFQRTNTNTSGAVGVLNFAASDDHSVANIQVLGDGDNEGAHIVFKTTTAAASADPYNAATVERLRITSDGKLKIGAGNPVASATVELENANPVFLIRDTASTSNDGDCKLAFGNANHYPTSYITHSWDGTNGGLHFYTRISGSEYERINIKANGQIWQYSNGGDNQFNSKRTGAAGSNGDYFFHLNAINESDTTVGQLGFHRDSAANDARFRIFTAPSGGSVQERLRITNNGRSFFNSGNQTNMDNMALSSNAANFSSFESTGGADSNLYSGVIHHHVVSRATSERTDSLFSFKGSGNCGFFAEVTAYFSAATVGTYQGRQRMWFRASRNSSNDFQITQAHNYDKIGTSTTTHFNPIWASSGSGGSQQLTVKVTTTAMTNYITIMYVTRFVTMDSIHTFTTLL